MSTEMVAHEAHEAGNALALGALSYADDTAMIEAATRKATALKRVVTERKLSTRIQGREYVHVDGWVTLAALCGLLPHVVACEEREDGSYLAVVELRDHAGTVKGRADAECGDSTDRPWHQRPKYARRSMAQTRATGKACRLALSWVMTMAGYAPTPAEEMSQDDTAPPPPRAATPARTIGGPSEKQLKRLFAISREHGWSDQQMRDLLGTELGIESSSELTRAQYDRLCDVLLPAGPAREGEVIAAGTDPNEPPF